MSEFVPLRAAILGGESFSAIACVDALIHAACKSRASDIHIDPAELDTRIRLRVDGELEDVAHLPRAHHSSVITRVKVLSQLRTDEHQAAQDGRFRVSLEGASIDIRVAVSPTYYGERIVLRLLVRTEAWKSLSDLGMHETDKRKVETALHRPHGMILASGPTGSGKTTTLYTLLSMIHTQTVSVVTVEDPIEYAIAGSCQIQVNPRTNLSFASGLRSILRQDPNIIMVGEIRDADTARLATNTALTGHLLLSTIHTNDAATALLRLMDLGVEQYLVSSTVSLVIAQRLVRTVCQVCSVACSYSVNELPPVLRAQGVRGENLAGAVAVGCGDCRGTGYKGRTALFEVLSITPTIRALLLRRMPAAEITRQAIAEGMRVMALDGLEKISAKQTTPAEIMRVLSE